MYNFNTLGKIVSQLELCEYQTPDGMHKLGDNAAFVSLKEMASKEAIDQLVRQEMTKRPIVDGDKEFDEYCKENNVPTDKLSCYKHCFTAGRDASIKSNDSYLLSLLQEWVTLEHQKDGCSHEYGKSLTKRTYAALAQ
jgi:hypothetical protein